MDTVISLSSYVAAAKSPGVPPVRHAKDMPYLEVLFDIIASAYATLPNRYSRLSRDACVTRRTAQNWLARTHAPRVSHIFVLAENNGAVRNAILDLIVNSGRRNYKKALPPSSNQGARTDGATISTINPTAKTRF